MLDHGERVQDIKHSDKVSISEILAGAIHPRFIWDFLVWLGWMLLKGLARKILLLCRIAKGGFNLLGIAAELAGSFAFFSALGMFANVRDRAWSVWRKWRQAVNWRRASKRQTVMAVHFILIMEATDRLPSGWLASTLGFFAATAAIWCLAMVHHAYTMCMHERDEQVAGQQ